MIGKDPAGCGRLLNSGDRQHSESGEHRMKYKVKEDQTDTKGHAYLSESLEAPLMEVCWNMDREPMRGS